MRTEVDGGKTWGLFHPHDRAWLVVGQRIERGFEPHRVDRSGGEQG